MGVCSNHPVASGVAVFGLRPVQDVAGGEIVSDYTELQKAAAYAAQDTIKFADEDEEMRALQQFHEEVSPETVLALIAENDRLHERKKLCPIHARAECIVCVWPRPEASEVTRFKVERDQLKAENEALRKDADRYRFIRNREHEEGLHALIMYRNRDANTQCIVGGMQADAVIDNLMKNSMAQGEQS